MKQIVMFTLLGILIPLFLDAEESDDIVEGLQAFYATTSDIKASFTQKVVKIGVGITLEKSGKVYFKKPGLMRWDYLVPEKVHYMSDGEHLFIYQVADNIIYKAGVKGSSVYLPFKFLLGEGDLRQDFVVQEIEQKEPSGTFSIPLLPVKGDTSFASASLLVVRDDQSVTVRSITIVDTAGNTNTITFSDVALDVGLPVDGFVTLPKGVPVQELSKKNTEPPSASSGSSGTP